MIDTSKVIHAPVGGGRYTVTAPIVKEDYGLYLLIEGLELPSTYEVDFSNSENSGTSVTMIGNADGVLIPSQFISSGKDIFAFLYHVGVDFGRTVYKFRIPNKLRPDRTDEQPTPEEQSTIDQAISALNTAVEQTAQDVIDADASAQSASQSAENAHNSVVDAQNYAESASGYASDAQGYANTASQKATAAGNSANQAAQIKTDIEGYVSTAQGYAQTATDKAAQASQSATNASNSATTASTKAGEASASATTASNKASEASGYATTASNKATEASGYASTASQKASDASDSASAALGYKTDAESAKTAAQTAQGKAEDAQEAAETAAASIQSSAAQIATNTADIADLQTDVAQNEADILKAFPTDSASGAIASFPDGADDIPLKSLIVNIDPVQDLSNGDPSPENICHINGWDGMTVNASGKNLLDPTVLKDQSSWNIITLHLTPNTLYVMSTNSNVSTLPIYFLMDGESQGSGTKVTASHPVVRLTNNDGILKIIQRRSSASESFSNYHYQIEIGSTPTPYELYQGQTIPITFGQTVYGGKLDVLSGVLRVEREMVILDGTESWSKPDNGFLTAKYKSDRSYPDAICSTYIVAKSYSGVNGTDKRIAITTSGVRLHDSQFANATALKTYLAENNVQLCYNLATPIEIQLDAHTINSLYGQNNIFADTGDCSVEYRADTKLYIARLTAPDSDDMIADANIVSGQYFMVGNSLYKATANIASGASVIVGTNAIRKSLSEALNEINA